MRYTPRLIAISLIFAISTMAQDRMYLEFTVNDTVKLKQLDEALNIGQQLQGTLKSLKEYQPTDKNIDKLSVQFKKYEDQMFKAYGLMPGLKYRMVPTSGSIYILVPKNKVSEYIQDGVTVKAGSTSMIVKNKQGQSVNCFKVLLRSLSEAKEVQQFNQTLRTAASIRQQISNLEDQLNKKPEIKKQQAIQEGMTKLKETLSSLDKSLKQKYEVTPRFKYIFEPQTGAVYLILNEVDLKTLGEINKAKK